MTRLLVAITLLVLFFSGATVAQTENENTLSYCEAEFARTFDPVTSQNDMANVRLTTLLFEGMFELTPDREPVRRLAEMYDVDADQKTVTVRLRRGIKWSDGGEVGAADVLETIRAYRDAESVQAKRIVADIAEARMDDPYSVRIVFKQPFPAEILLKKLTFKILPRHKLDRLPLTRQSDIARRPVGTGYFAYAERSPNQLTLKANPGFRSRNGGKDGPAIDNVMVYEIPQAGSQVESIKNNLVDIVVEVSPRDIVDLKAIELQIKSYESLSFQFIGFNFVNPVLRDKRVRQALTHGFNRANVLDRIYQNLGKLISGPYPRSSSFYVNELAPLVYDPARARALLDEAGFTQTVSGVRQDNSGRTLEFRFVVPRYVGGNDYSTRVFNQFISDMREIGVRIQLIDEEFDTWRMRVLERHDFDLAFAELVFDETNDISNLFHSANTKPWEENFISYNNPEVDALLAEARATMNTDLKININKKLHRLLREDCPYLFLWSLQKTAAAQKRVRNFVTTVTPFSFFDYANKWFLEGVATE